MTVGENEKLVLKVFDAIERRDDKLFRDALHPEFEIVWPTSLPYGGDKGVTWSETWEPFQPTAAERKLDPRVVAANENTVVVLWRQRGLAPSGDRFNGEVLGLYQIRDGKLSRAQMFYFDSAAVANFLAKARKRIGRESAR